MPETGIIILMVGCHKDSVKERGRVMENQTQKIRQPVLFLPHGGGPCFFMDWPGWENMEAYLRNIASTLPQRPTAIVVMSGH